MNIRLWAHNRVVALLALIGIAFIASPAAAQAITEPEAREIAAEAYVYAYPMVLMETTRQYLIAGGRAVAGAETRMNNFRHRPTFPDYRAQSAVRPNADTLYSILWYDVSEQPLVVTMPATAGRYYLVTVQDMWTETFATLGTRTTGNGPQRLVLVGPNWRGTLPEGVEAVHSPTPVGMLAVRVQTNGVADYPFVRSLQAGMATGTLADGAPPTGSATPPVAADGARAAPVDQVGRMSAEAYFTTFAELMKVNPPHFNDQPILARMRRLGLVPGRAYDFNAAPRQVQDALRAAVAPATARIHAAVGQGVGHNGWLPLGTPIGTYGTFYLGRAAVAFAGIFANSPEDALYPTLSLGPDGRPLDSGRRYVLHFERGQLPPARAFWSVTMYNERQFFAENPIGRYAIGDRDNLAFNPDGSLDLYIQREAPGGDRDRNWLPTPATGPFSLTMRLYWPEQQALDGIWAPPALSMAQ